jgi:endonuclease YncB( thermonuclease family)
MAPAMHPPRQTTRQPLPVVRTLGLLVAAALVLACGGDSGPVSAGAGRDAPAELDGADADASPDDVPLEDATEPPDAGDVAEDAPAPDLADSTADPDVTDTGSDPTGNEPVDRILREGAVGTVTVVTDGDTVHVTVNNWYHRVRMQGINAPECFKTLTDTANGRQYTCSSDDEHWGLAAGQALTERALGHVVTVYCDQSPGQPCPLDIYDRPLAFLEDGEGDLGEWMARNGHAMSFTRFPSTRRARYCAAEDLALAEELGMWALGDRTEVLSRMSEDTQDWYADRDRRCAQALE